MSDEHCTLREDLRRLRRSQLRLQLLVAGLALAIGFGACAGDDDDSVVEASVFRLVDPAGKAWGEWRVTDDGPQLVMFDERTVERIALGHGSEGTALYLRDSVETTRVGVAQFPHGGGGFALHGPDSKGAAVLYLQGDGRLTFYDSAGVVTNQVRAR